MLRIAEIITRADLGGGQVHLLELISSLRSKIEFHVLVGTEGYFTKECKEIGVPVYILPDMARELSISRDVRALIRVRRQLARISPDLIHAHTAKAGVLGRLCGWSLSIPTIYTPHGFAFSGRNGPPLRALSWAVEACLRITRSEVVTVSSFERDLAIQTWVAPSRRVHLIPNGIRDSAPRAKADSPGPPNVVMVARFAPPKDYETLVRACAKVQVPLRLTLVGSGPLQPQIQALAVRVGLSDCVRFTGECSTVGRELELAQIVVLSSRSEAQGISLLEGMRAGLPVVATNAEGMKDLVIHGKTGYLVNPGDVDGLAEVINVLAEDPRLRIEMGAGGRRLYETQFQADDMVRKIERLYGSTAKRSTRNERIQR